MQIFVKNLMGATTTYDVQPTDSILALKEKIMRKEMIQTDHQRLIFAGCQLEDNYLIQDCKFKRGEDFVCLVKQSTIHLVLRLRGGGFPSIRFNSLNQPVIKKITPSNKISERTIQKGLNLEGVCKNQKCKVFNKNVWISKGYGKFNMNMEVYKAECPVCKQFCDQVENMGLYQAKCTSRGKVKGQQEQKRMQSIQKKRGQLLTFENKDQTRVDWLYLEMEVIQL